MCDVEQEVWSRSLTSSQVRGAGYFLKIISFLVSTVPKPSLFGGLSYLGDVLFNDISREKSRRNRNVDGEVTCPCPLNPVTQSEANPGKLAPGHTWRLQAGPQHSQGLALTSNK